MIMVMPWTHIISIEHDFTYNPDVMQRASTHVISQDTSNYPFCFYCDLSCIFENAEIPYLFYTDEHYTIIESYWLQQLIL